MMTFMVIKGNIICWHFLKALPSADNFHCILREITVYFSGKVFSLKIWGHFIQQCNSWNLGYVSTFKEVKKPWWCSSMEQQWGEIFEEAFLFSCPFVLTRNIFNLSKKKTILLPNFFDPIVRKRVRFVQWKMQLIFTRI